MNGRLILSCLITKIIAFGNYSRLYNCAQGNKIQKQVVVVVVVVIVSICSIYRPHEKYLGFHADKPTIIVIQKLIEIKKKTNRDKVWFITFHLVKCVHVKFNSDKGKYHILYHDRFREKEWISRESLKL
jgi:hypothetical protein